MRKPDKHYTVQIVSPTMVWISYTDEFKTKHLHELTGKQATDFQELTEEAQTIFIQNIKP